MQYITPSTPDEVKKFFETFGKSFSFDTETTSAGIRAFIRENGKKKKIPDDIQLQALNYYYLEMEMMTLYDGQKGCLLDFNILPIKKTIEIIKPYFESAITIVGHNLVYDMIVIYKYGIDLINTKIYCTMVADHLLNEERKHGLKSLAKEILGKENTISYEEARKKGGEAFAQYAINDAVWTWELCKWQQEHIKQENLVDLFRNIEMPFQLVLRDMAINGFMVDIPKVKFLIEKMDDLREHLVTQMLDKLGLKFQLQHTVFGDTKIVSPVNFNSNDQMSKVLFEKYGLEVVETTPGGKPSVGRKTLEKYKEHEFVSLLWHYRKASKLIDAFLVPLIPMTNPDGYVRASFRDTGTKTGRLSSSKPNLQQLSKHLCWRCGKDKITPEGVCKKCGAEHNYNLRECFVAGTGRKLIVSDFSGQEIRVCAEVSRDPTLIKSLHNGHDVHLAVANTVFNLGIPEEVLRESHPDHEKTKEQFKVERTKAKIVTFGTLYGKGSFGFSKDFETTEEEAQQLIDNFFEGMPSVKDAIKSAHQEVYNNGYVTYLSGRKRHFEKVRKDDWEGYTKRSLRQAFNAIIQGMSADMMRIAMNNIYYRSKNNPEWDLKIHATVHDEVIVSCREGYAEQVRDFVKNEMESCVQFCVPISSETEIGDNYGECK